MDQIFSVSLFPQVGRLRKCPSTIFFTLFALRDRKYAEGKDIFTECGKIDDQDLKKDIQTGVNDPLVNITEFEDKTIDEGYGTSVEKLTNSTGTVSQAMIKRFNQHSIMVNKINF